jgi:hypothetical protein
MLICLDALKTNEVSLNRSVEKAKSGAGRRPQYKTERNEYTPTFNSTVAIVKPKTAEYSAHISSIQYRRRATLTSNPSTLGLKKGS